MGSTVPSHISPLIFYTQAESGAYLRASSSRFPRLRRHSPSVPSTATGSIPSLSVRAIPYQWRFTPRVRRHGAKRPQRSMSNGRCLFSKPHGPINMHLFFNPTNYWYIQWTSAIDTVPKAVKILIIGLLIVYLCSSLKKFDGLRMTFFRFLVALHHLHEQRKQTF